LAIIQPSKFESQPVSFAVNLASKRTILTPTQKRREGKWSYSRLYQQQIADEQHITGEFASLGKINSQNSQITVQKIYIIHLALNIC
jgi:hypothetical protein